MTQAIRYTTTGFILGAALALWLERKTKPTPPKPGVTSKPAPPFWIGTSTATSTLPPGTTVTYRAA